MAGSVVGFGEGLLARGVMVEVAAGVALFIADEGEFEGVFEAAAEGPFTFTLAAPFTPLPESNFCPTVFKTPGLGASPLCAFTEVFVVGEVLGEVPGDAVG